jgi:hypothetical protein
MRSAALRVKWAKTKARAEQWREEVALVSTEMKRTLDYGHHLHKDWLALAESLAGEDSVLLKGQLAYAHKQAAFKIAYTFKLLSIWMPVLAMVQSSSVAGHLLATERVVAFSTPPVVDFEASKHNDNDEANAVADIDDKDD